VKRSILSTLLLFFVALGFTGTQVLAAMITPAEAAEKAFAAEEREEQVSRKSPSRRPQTRGKKGQRLFVNPSTFIGSTSNALINLGSRSFLQSNLPPGYLHLLQVCRI